MASDLKRSSPLDRAHRDVSAILSGESGDTEVKLPDVGEPPRVVLVKNQGYVLAGTNLPPWRFAELHRHPTPVWIPCPGCPEWICTVHDCHAFECDYPPVEDWDFDPYSPVPPGVEIPTTPDTKENSK